MNCVRDICAPTRATGAATTAAGLSGAGAALTLLAVAAPCAAHWFADRQTGPRPLAGLTLFETTLAAAREHGGALPVELVLVSHGEPVLQDGGVALERALS